MMRWSLGLQLAFLTSFAFCLLGCADGKKDGAEANAYPWGLPERIDVEGGVVEPKLAVSASGSAVAVWVQWEGAVWANRYTPGAGWGIAERIDGGAPTWGLEPAVAISPDGHATAVWRVGEAAPQIMASRFVPGEGWEAAVPIESTVEPNGELHYPRVAMDLDANAMAVWMRSGATGAIVASRYSESEGWSVPKRIDDEGTGSPDDPRGVAIDASGRAIAIWGGDDQQGGSVFANRYTPSDGWGAPAVIDGPEPIWTNGAELAMDAGGHAFVVWRQGRDEQTGSLIMANRFTPDGGWNTPSRIESRAFYSQEPHVAVNDNGTAMAVWIRSARGAGELSGIWSLRFTPALGWEPEPVQVHIIGTRSAGAAYPRIALDPDDNALVAWRAYEQYEEHIWSSHYSPATGWDTAVVLNFSRTSYRKGFQQIGIDGSGRGTAVWFQAGHSGYQAMANLYDDTPAADDPIPTWRTICDARCARSAECSLDDSHCWSECMDALRVRPCDPNQDKLDVCVEQLGEWRCDSVESGFSPDSCAHACAGQAPADPVEPDVCGVPLVAYCEGSSCPTWDEAVADAEEEGGRGDDFCEVVGGECGELRYIDTVVGIGGGFVEYFDESGSLVSRQVRIDTNSFCHDTSFDKWYGERPECEPQPSHNYCKGYGVRYCSAVAECGAITESECLDRYDDPRCWRKWGSYVYCFSRDGTCESCAERLTEWEACIGS